MRHPKRWSEILSIVFWNYQNQNLSQHILRKSLCIWRILSCHCFKRRWKNVDYFQILLKICISVSLVENMLKKIYIYFIFIICLNTCENNRGCFWLCWKWLVIILKIITDKFTIFSYNNIKYFTIALTTITQ